MAGATRIAGVDLEATLTSGQTFGFHRVDGGFLGAPGGRPVWCARQGDDLLVDSPWEDQAFWRGYFDAEERYPALWEGLGDPLLQSCLSAFPGLKLLRQDPWETICAFILSANNHQRRIEALFQGIARELGDRHVHRGGEVFSFPKAQVLAEAPEALLRTLGVGYRAPYLIKSARMVAEGFSLGLDEMDYEEALAHLTALSGVGEKVGDCVLLFSSRHRNAFPMDVWMQRVMCGPYGLTGSRAQVKRQAQALFGQRAGVAQQFLFHGARTGILAL